MGWQVVSLLGNECAALFRFICLGHFSESKRVISGVKQVILKVIKDSTILDFPQRAD